jgi:hypothetical protein
MITGDQRGVGNANGAKGFSAAHVAVEPVTAAPQV